MLLPFDPEQETAQAQAAPRQPKKRGLRPLRSYLQELNKRVRETYGKDGDAKVKQMADLIRGAAQTHLLLDKVFDELMQQPIQLTEVGSQRQLKKSPNPLLQTYTSLSDRFLDYMDKLGLSSRKAAVRAETVTGANDLLQEMMEALK